MAKKKTNQIVKESNVIARARIKPKTESVWEERVIARLLSKVRIDDHFLHEQTITFEELNDGYAMSNSQHTEAKRAVDNLGGKTYVMPQGWRGIMVYPIFQHIGIDDEGNIKVKLNPDLCEHYLELKEQFAERRLPEFQALSGTYAQMLFRHLNSWKARGEVDISIDELHDFLSVPPSSRANFKEFRLRILEPAHREITEKTSLSYTWEPVRKGLRKVEAVHFTFGVKAITPEAQKVEATPKKKGRPGKVNRELDGWSREELPKIQRLAEECFHETEDGARKCVPQKKSEVCLYCTTRGRMWSKTYLESMQGRLPFDEAYSTEIKRIRAI